VNPVLESKLTERAQQLANMDALLTQVSEQDRDLVDAERSVLTATQERIAALDAQIEPLAALEQVRDAHAAVVGALPRPVTVRDEPRRMDATGDRGITYRSAGEYIVDYMAAYGIGNHGIGDDAARARITQTRVVADQKTSDTPGILPTPIVGQVVNLIDANRPLITSLGGTKALGAIPGTTFTRPKITVHTLAGAQAGEKTQLPSQKMTIASVSFTKATYGGTVDISRQDMDWSQPSAWDVLVTDLANQYAIQVETAVASDFATKATGVKPPALPAVPVLADWMKGLYTAAMHSYQAGQRMPTRIWCSLDVWAALGSLVDSTRVVLPVDTTREMGAPGTSSLADFRGDLLGLPRIVVPLFPAKTCIVGPDTLYETYEEVIGLLSVIEPSILGVQVAYGGYVAFGSLAQTAHVALDLSAVTSLPTEAEATVDVGTEANEPEIPEPEPATDDTGEETGGGGAAPGGRNRRHT
jgi:HK97 family phage major capsid protein